MIDFTYLEGKDGELVVKELATVDSHNNRVSSYLFKRPYSWEDMSLINVRLNEAIDHGCNWNDVYVPYSDLENVVHCEATSAVVICFGPLKTEFISSLINLTVIDITQLGCPPIADINLSTISGTFACHNKSKHVYALRTAYSVAQWLHFYTISLQYVSCPAQPECH